MLTKLRTCFAYWFKLTPNDSLYDRGLVWLFISFLAIGFIMVTSASVSINSEAPYAYAIKDGIYIIVAIIVWSIFLVVPIEKWEKNNVALLIITLLLLISVLLGGREINGAVRWISFGSINFQPAELAKLALISYFSGFFVRKYDEMISKPASFIRPTTVFALFGGLLMLQPDMGSTAVLFVLTFLMLFIMGARLSQFLFLGMMGISLFYFFVITSEYRLQRVIAFRDPFADVTGDGYQLANSQMALGLGKVWGQGLGNSIQKLEYLPEAHTDFVMAVLGEELGLIGVLFVIVLLCLLTLKALKISKESLLLEERFKGFFAFGIALWIFIQGFVNIGVVSGLLPTKGLTFPLVSYGGSSLIIISIAIAVLVRIDYENRVVKIGHAKVNSI